MRWGYRQGYVVPRISKRAAQWKKIPPLSNHLLIEILTYGKIKLPERGFAWS